MTDRQAVLVHDRLDGDLDWHLDTLHLPGHRSTSRELDMSSALQGTRCVAKDEVCVSNSTSGAVLWSERDNRA